MKTTKHIPFETLETSLIERFESIVGMYADKDAIVDGKQKITYKDLDEKASKLALIILEEGSDKRQQALFLENGISQFVAILAILKSGCAYIPVDTSWPAHRIEKVLADSNPGLIITNNLNMGQVTALPGSQTIINIDNSGNPEINKPLVKAGADDLAHILYTSGSSGEPKGVYTTHRNQIHFIKRLSEFIHITPDDSFAYYFSIGFSAHAMPLFGILLNGGTLCLYDLKKNGFQGMADFFIEKEISIALMIPSVLRHFRITLDENFKFKKLRTLLIGGETLYRSDIKLIQPHMKRKAEIINIYASTEAFLARAYRMINHKVSLKQNIIPIGFEIDGMDIRIVNEDGQICDHNQVGEMIITSPYLAMGYWNDAEQSAKDFSQENGNIIFRSRDLAYSLSDGSIVHVGRKDSMVKIRGQRVDLGEVENMMLSNFITEVAAVLKETPTGSKQLIAYYVSRADTVLNESDIRKYLVKHLPDFMVPSVFVEMDTLPKTDSGKTDYKALPDPAWEDQQMDGEKKHARTATESDLVDIFERHLEVHPIGVTDNILESGLDSLKLFVAFDTVEKHFKIKIDIDHLAENPTIEALAKSIEQSE